MAIGISLYYFQDLYRVLLVTESEGILDDVNIAQVEKMILTPEPENK